MPSLSRLRVLVTAGPTREPIDAVRYISNRSSGRMGTALAEAASRHGFAVTLLLGAGCPPPARAARTSVSDAAEPPPPQVQSPIALERFETTTDLAGRLDRLWPHHDILLMAAAVSDHRPVVDPAILAASEGKLARGDGPIVLNLEPTPDLLARLSAASRPDQTLIGFALEPPARLREAALSKLRRKGVHGIVANPLGTMDSDTIEALLLLADGRSLSPAPGHLPKDQFADWLLDQVVRLRDGAPSP